ncbi:MAG: DUF3604 domain-containing protein [Haloplanus sp.]
MVSRTEHGPHGRASIDPADDVVAGGYATWTITYTVGDLGLDDGGTLLVAFSQTTDMGDPQFDTPSAPNYCRAETSGDARLDAEYDPDGHVRPMKHAVRVTARDGSLAPGETITLHLGETREGSLGMHVQTFPEADFAFRVLVDPHNTERFVALPQDLTVDVVPGVATDVAAVLPSTAEVDESARLGVRAEDYWGNVATGFDGRVRVDAPDGLRAPDHVELDGGTGTATVTPTEPGVYRLRVEADAPNATAESNPLSCRASVTDRTYWGDPHGQTGETVGTGTVRDYFRHLAGPAFLDFGAHAGNDFQITDDLWAEIKAAGRAAHDPGEFVTFHCYEWSANTALGGDHNVYFRGDDPEIVRSSNWLTGARERREGTRPVAALYERFADRDDVLIVPHQGGRPATLETLDPETTPFVEIVSCWGVFEWFAEEAYDRGYPVGVVGGSDDHSGRPGTAPPDNLPKHNVEGGLMAARAPELTRDALWDAFTGRHVYATTGDRILLDVRLDGARMGDRVAVSGVPELDVTVHGTAPLRAVDCFRGSDRVATRDLTEGDDVIELEWTGARSEFRNKRLDWSGGAALDRGRIVDADGFGFDHPEEGITRRRPGAVFWDGRTTGNYQGVHLRLDAPDDATLRVGTTQAGATVTLADLTADSPRHVDVPAAGIDARLAIRRVGTADSRDATLSIRDPDAPDGTSPYWVRVRQVDGELAWSSPVFVER